MANRERGARNVLRGVVIAVLVVAAIVLLAVYWRRIVNGVVSVYHFVVDNVPDNGNQRTAILVYLILAAIAAVAFSKAGHFVAYGIAVGLGTLLWFLFWEGFPPLKLSPSWTNSLNLPHLGEKPVILWAVIAVVVITVIFVPLEMREKVRRRRDLIPDVA